METISRHTNHSQTHNTYIDRAAELRLVKSRTLHKNVSYFIIATIMSIAMHDVITYGENGFWNDICLFACRRRD
jgi:hypothetical protein